MASSVSSERAFSSAGITISKRRNRLKGDIVEALQFLKCLLHRDLIFRTQPSTSLDDLDDEVDIMGGNTQPVPNAEKSPSSDQMWLEDDDAVTEG
jgi:hypothetical protein